MYLFTVNVCYKCFVSKFRIGHCVLPVIDTFVYLLCVPHMCVKMTCIDFTAVYVCVKSGPVESSVQAKCSPCVSSPCQNQGICKVHHTQQYTCVCKSGFTVCNYVCVLLVAV